MATPDVNQKLLNKLRQLYAEPAKGYDLTTLMARKSAQDKQASTSDPTLWDGKDITDDVRTFLNGLADF